MDENELVERVVLGGKCSKAKFIVRLPYIVTWLLALVFAQLCSLNSCDPVFVHLFVSFLFVGQ